MLQLAIKRRKTNILTFILLFVCMVMSLTPTDANSENHANSNMQKIEHLLASTTRPSLCASASLLLSKLTIDSASIFSKISIDHVMISIVRSCRTGRFTITNIPDPSDHINYCEPIPYDESLPNLDKVITRLATLDIITSDIKINCVILDSFIFSDKKLLNLDLSNSIINYIDIQNSRLSNIDFYNLTINHFNFNNNEVTRNFNINRSFVGTNNPLHMITRNCRFLRFNDALFESDEDTRYSLKIHQFNPTIKFYGNKLYKINFMNTIFYNHFDLSDLDINEGDYPLETSPKVGLGFTPKMCCIPMHVISAEEHFRVDQG